MTFANSLSASCRAFKTRTKVPRFALPARLVYHDTVYSILNLIHRVWHGTPCRRMCQDDRSNVTRQVDRGSSDQIGRDSVNSSIDLSREIYTSLFKSERRIQILKLDAARALHGGLGHETRRLPSPNVQCRDVHFIL